MCIFAKKVSCTRIFTPCTRVFTNFRDSQFRVQGESVLEGSRKCAFLTKKGSCTRIFTPCTLIFTPCTRVFPQKETPGQFFPRFCKSQCPTHILMWGRAPSSVFEEILFLPRSAISDIFCVFQRISRSAFEGMRNLCGFARSATTSKMWEVCRDLYRQTRPILNKSAEFITARSADWQNATLRESYQGSLTGMVSRGPVSLCSTHFPSLLPLSRLLYFEIDSYFKQIQYLNEPQILEFLSVLLCKIVK